MARSERTLVLLTAAALTAVYVVWGSTYLAIAVSLESLPPLLLMGVRSVVAGAVLYGSARMTGAPRANVADWKNATLVGVLFFVIGHGLLSWGETRVASGAAAVVIATEPLFIVLIGWRGGVLAGHRRGVRPTRRVAAAVLIGLIGVAVMMLPGTRGSLDALGVSALVIASLSWSIGTYHVAASGSPARAAGMQLLAGGTILLVLSSLLGEVSGLDVAAVTARSMVALAYLIVFGSVVTFGAYIWLLRRIGPERVATHTFVNPVIALALGVWLGGETLGLSTLVASALVLAAVVLLLTSRARRGAPAAMLRRIEARRLARDAAA
jgi:drug/metabolite transporter (DMT)-like permease